MWASVTSRRVFWCAYICTCMYVYIYIYIHTRAVSYTLKVFALDFFRKLATNQTTRRHVMKLHFPNHVILTPPLVHSSIYPVCPTIWPNPFQSYFSTDCHLVLLLSILLYTVLYLRSSSSCLRLLLLPVTSAISSVFPWVTFFRRQFLHELWPSSFPSFYLLYVPIFFSFCSACSISLFIPTHLIHLSSAPHIRISQLLVIYFPIYPSLTTTHSCAPNATFH